MPRKPIRSLCEEAAKQAAGVSKTSFFSEKFKRSREISSLGRFVELYTKQKRVPELNFVDGDVTTLTGGPISRCFCQESDAQKACDIEVVEIQEPGRRRHDEYKSGQVACAFIPIA